MNKCKKFLLSALMGIFLITVSAGIAACSGGGSDHTHSLTHVEAASATCTADGNTEYWYCGDCGKYYSDEDAATEITLANTVISAAGHTWNGGEVTAEATCTTDGVTTYTCTECGETYTEAITATGHTWDGGEVTAEATCTTDGVKTYTCTECGETYTEAIAATGHTATSHTSYDGTYHYYTCDTCGTTDIAEAHAYENGICACGHEEGTSAGLAYTAVYDSTDDTAIVSYTVSGIGDCTDTEIVIPSTYNSFPVTEIAASAFRGNTTITSVVIPGSVTTIGSYAFYGCTSLASATISDGVTSIDSSAFTNTVVKNVYYNGGLSGWLGITFGNNSSNPLFKGAPLYFTDTDGNYELVTSVAITDVTEINSYAFYGCSSLMSVTIGESVTSIGSAAFSLCRNITEVYNYSEIEITASSSSSVATVSGNVAAYTNVPVYTSESTASGEFMTEGDYIFYAYTSDETTTYYLVRYMGSRTELILPTLTIDGQAVNYNIKKYAFYGNGDITSVTIPENVAEIGNYAFYNCTGLTAIYYNATAATGTSAGYYFSYAGNSGDGITVYIGANVTSMPKYLFHSANSNTYANITTVVFAENSQMTTITSSVFYGMYALTSVVLPASVTTIESAAFNNCSALTTVYYYGTAEQKAEISITSTYNTYLTGATWYYYAEDDGTVTDAGNYWYYDEDDNIVIWTIEDATT